MTSALAPQSYSNAYLRAFAVLLAAGVAATFIWIACDSPGDRFGPRVAGVAIGAWLVSSGGRIYWTRRNATTPLSGRLSFHPLYVLLLIMSSVYTTLALHEADLQLQPTPDQPDFVPGLFTDLSVYFLAVHAAVVALVALYGHTRGRALETAVVVQIVFLAPLFEPVLGLDIGAALLAGLALTMVAFGLFERGGEGISGFRWTPFGPPLVVFLLAGLIASGTAAYVQHSLVVLVKLSALVTLTMMLFQLVRSHRQIWLIWAAVVLPTVGMAIAHLVKMVEISDHMGLEFAVRMRFTFFGLIGANTIGLALAVDILLIIGALFSTRRPLLRAGLLLLLVPVVPSLLSVRSSAGLVALGAGLLVIGVASCKAPVLREVRRRLLSPGGMVTALTFVSVVAAIVLVPNPYQAEWKDEVSDPTTGRGVRSQLWRWSVEDIKHNPLVGVGLGDRRFDARTQHVPEFPFRDVTQLIERRLLLGGDGTEWRVFVWAQPHNILLLVFESMGVVGLLPALWLCAALVWCGMNLILKPMTRERWVMTIAIACVGGGLAWSFFALGQNVAYLPLTTWALLGLLGGAYCMVTPDAGGPARAQLGRLVPSVERLRPFAGPATAVALLVVFLGIVARPVVAETFFRRANEARLEGDFVSAIDEIKAARRLDPLHAGYADFLAQSYYRTAQEERERSTLLRLLEIQPETASNHTRIGWTYWYQGDFSQAVDAFERAVELDPWNSLGSNNVYSLALAYQYAGHRQDAIDTFQQAFFLEPALVDEGAWYPVERPGLGPDLLLDPAYSSDLSNPRLQLLLKQRVYGLFTNAGPPELPVAADRTLYLSDVLEDGYRDYQAELDDDEPRAYGMLSALARTYARADLHEQSLELAKELSVALRDESYVFYDLGLEFAALGRADEARAAFADALAISQASNAYDIYEPFLHYQVGLLDQAAGDHEAALLQFRKTLDTYRWPYFPQAYEALANAARLTGRDAEAASALRKLDYLLGTERS